MRGGVDAGTTWLWQRRLGMLRPRQFGRACVMLLLLTACPAPPARADAAGERRAPANFVFFGAERTRIAEPAFLESRNIVGAQLRYTWRELEPERDRYDFRHVLADLEYLERHGKRLFVQVQDVSFSEAVPVPDYLRTDPAFGGGAARKFEEGVAGASGSLFDGWVARRWDPAVRARFAALLRALAREVDGRIEGLNLAETSVGFGDDVRRHPSGFTYERYAEGERANLAAARSAFARSAVLIYANFMPGEWLPWEDRGYLRGLYAFADSIGAGVGGPDLLPYRKGQRNHGLGLIARRPSTQTAGLAVQDGNLAERNPATGRRVTVAELYRVAREEFHLDYIFWGTQEPYYSRDVLPFLRALETRDRGGRARRQVAAP